jgi:hypothetical protein
VPSVLCLPSCKDILGPFPGFFLCAQPKAKRKGLAAYIRNFKDQAWKWCALVLPTLHWSECGTHPKLIAREAGKCSSPVCLWASGYLQHHRGFHRQLWDGRVNVDKTLGMKPSTFRGIHVSRRFARGVSLTLSSLLLAERGWCSETYVKSNSWQQKTGSPSAQGGQPGMQMSPSLRRTSSCFV